MPFYIVWLFQLSEDLFRKDLSEFNTHLICEMPSAIKKSATNSRREPLPNELTPQMTPCTKILCSYKAIRAPVILPSTPIKLEMRGRESAPSVAGVNRGNIILVLGLLPSNTLLLISASLAFGPSSCLTSSSVLPNASASGCAKKLDKRIRWCLEFSIGLCVVVGAIKSVGMILVPWWTSW